MKIMLKLSKRASVAIAIVYLCIVAGANVSQGQVHSVQTYIAYYGRTPEKQYGQSFSGYSILVDDPSSTNNVQAILKGQPNMVGIFHYLDMNYLDQPGSRSTGWKKDIIEHHEDFLLPTIGGEVNKNLPPKAKYAWGYMQPYDSTSPNRDRFFLNPASRDFALYYAAVADSILTLQNNRKKEGIFVDNVWQDIRWNFSRVPKALQIDINGDGVLDSRDDAAWVDAIIDFSKRIRERLGSDVPLIANMGRCWSYKDGGFRIMANSAFDGAMNESFLHSSLSNDSSSYPSLDIWKINVNDIMIADSLGKILLCQSFGKENDAQARLFCVASFLLGEGNKSYFNYCFHMSYGSLYHFPEFALPIGSPRENYTNADQAFEASSGLYKRSFDSVDVIVNPSDHVVRFNSTVARKALKLVGGVQEAGGHVVWETQQTFDMKPHSAIILGVQ